MARPACCICTRQENQRNKRKQYGATSKFKGVCYDPRKKKWYAKCRVGGKRPRLGLYANEVDAARAYDLAAVRWYGEFARPNSPEEWPPQRRAQVHAEWLETVKREGWEPAIKGRGPRTTSARRGKAKSQSQKAKGKRTATHGKARACKDPKRTTSAIEAQGRTDAKRGRRKPPRKTRRTARVAR